MNHPFITGLDLSEALYREAVGPILARHFPGLTHSAALIGPGSEVLGYDTEQSTDHNWGPRLLIFLAEDDLAACGEKLDRALRRELPSETRGYPTHFAEEGDTRWMVPLERGPVNHGVQLLTVSGYFTEMLGFDPAGEIRAPDWVSVPQQSLLMLTAGRVFHDGLGQLGEMRAKLRYYPHDVWLYLLAAHWARIAQEQAFMGRCGQVGDDLGSRLIAARLVRDLIGLCFLMERRYAPYIKWLGSAFARLGCADEAGPALARVLEADTWEARQSALSLAYGQAAAMHNALGITEPLPTEVTPYYDRPFLVIGADRFVEALRATITNGEVLALPARLGGVDQWVDSTDALAYLARIRGVYG